MKSNSKGEFEMFATFDYNEVVSRATLEHEDGSVAEVLCVKPGKPFMDFHGAYITIDGAPTCKNNREFRRFVTER